MTFNPRALVAVIAFWILFGLAVRGMWLANAVIESFTWGVLVVASLAALVVWMRRGSFAPYNQRVFRWMWGDDHRR